MESEERKVYFIRALGKYETGMLTTSTGRIRLVVHGTDRLEYGHGYLVCECTAAQAKELEAHFEVRPLLTKTPEPIETRKEQDVTDAILRHLGLEWGGGPCSKLQMERMVHHLQMTQVLRQLACAEHFVTLTELISKTQMRAAYAYRHAELYSLVPGYAGNALHYVAHDVWLRRPGRMPYVVAMLRYLGCDLDSQEDSNGECANLLVARAMGSHDVFVPASLLLRWLYNRKMAHYVPCAWTKELLNLQ
jgi:hypothetical protein